MEIFKKLMESEVKVDDLMQVIDPYMIDVLELIKNKELSFETLYVLTKNNPDNEEIWGKEYETYWNMIYEKIKEL